MRTINDLIKSIAEGESSAHAYIVEGAPGDARAEFLKRLSAGLECLDEDVHRRPCGRCDACIQVRAGTSPDVVYMQKSGKSSYRTEDAAAFTERLGMSAYGRHLIGIIDDAESLSEIVQNKLLKTLEEPPAHVILLLAAAGPDSLLSTVRSRCSRIRMAEYEGYEGGASEDASGDIMEGVFMLLTQRSSFSEFRDFLDKQIKTGDDAIKLISLAEDKLRGAMVQDKAVALCSERIDLAERCAADISRGMDRNKALKRLFLNYGVSKTSKA